MPDPFPVPADRAAIEAAIPHRDPFLFVDAVEAADEMSLTARWTVPPDADWFRGHYPGAPVLPGVLTAEHALQTAALFVSRALGGFGADDGVPVLAKLEQARFKRVVRPGETLTTTVTLVERFGPAWILAATVRCDGAKTAALRCVLTATGATERRGSDPTNNTERRGSDPIDNTERRGSGPTDSPERRGSEPTDGTRRSGA